MIFMNFFNRSRSAEMAKRRVEFEAMLNNLKAEIAAMRVEREAMAKDTAVMLIVLNCLIDVMEQRLDQLAQSTKDMSQELTLHCLRESSRGGAPVGWQTFVDSIHVIRAAIDTGKISREEALRGGERSLNAYYARYRE